MRQDVKDLADAMERGWNMVPVTCYPYFNDDYDVDNIPLNKVTSACAIGHALLGKGTTNIWNSRVLFPVLQKQFVIHPHIDDSIPLASAICNLLLIHEWTTPQVIAWLRSHQEDDTPSMYDCKSYPHCGCTKFRECWRNDE
jgi:hypothetical protein